MFDEAISAFQKALTLSGGSPVMVAALGRSYALAGNRDEAHKALRELKRLSKRGYVSSYDLALVYAGMDEKNQAFGSLEKAYEERSRWLCYLKVEPRLDPLRADPRFQDLLRRIGLPS